MGILYNILEGLKVNENRMSFASDKEAKEFCEDNGISTHYIETDSDGSYIDDVDTLIRRAVKDEKKEIDNRNPKRHRVRKNSYNYKGLEDLTDDQIRFLEINKAIVKRSNGTYYADWSKARK